MPAHNIDYGIVGGLREDYFISASGEAHQRVMGGNAIYAAAGARVWTPSVGLASRVGENYPAEWLAELEARGIDTRGVKVLPGWHDTRTFYAYHSLEDRSDTDPAAHFARLGLPLPPELENYTTSTAGEEMGHRFSTLAVRPSEVPRAYLHAHGFHMAPGDLMTHLTLPDTLSRHFVRHITCDPSIRYMQPNCAADVKNILHGLSAFLPSEVEARAFFREPLEDLWQAAEAFGALGAKIVVLKLGARGLFVYDSAGKRRWHVPAYPARVKDVTGAGDACCGGFLVGLIQTDDPLEAALRGAVSASIVVEGLGALYALETTPGLAEARCQALRDAVRAI